MHNKFQIWAGFSFLRGINYNLCYTISLLPLQPRKVVVECMSLVDSVHQVLEFYNFLKQIFEFHYIQTPPRFSITAISK